MKRLGTDFDSLLYFDKNGKYLRLSQNDQSIYWIQSTSKPNKYLTIWIGQRMNWVNFSRQELSVRSVNVCCFGADAILSKY